jgi:integrase
MASFHYYLKDKNAESKSAIYLKFDDGTNNCKLAIQQSINPKQWNSAQQRASKSLSGFGDFNEKLKMMRDKCESIYINLTKSGKFSIENLKEEFKDFIAEIHNKKRKVENDSSILITDKVVDFYDSYLKAIANVKGIATLKSHKSTLANLREFEKQWKRRVTFERVDLEFYYDYIEFNEDVKGHKPNYIGKHIKNIKVVLNEATERKVNANMSYRSRKFMAPSEDVDNIYLDEDELQQIFEYDFRKDKRLENARDLFLIGCWTGLRYSDFSQLTTANFKTTHGVELVVIKTQKTGETIEIPLHPTVKAILKKYKGTKTGFPRNISGQKLNDYLKDIGKKVGLKEPILQNATHGKLKSQTTKPKYELICTHTARRSFATNLYKGGLGSIHIIRITGHKSEKNFLKYIKISKEENALALHDHWAKNMKLKVV